MYSSRRFEILLEDKSWPNIENERLKWLPVYYEREWFFSIDNFHIISRF